MNTPHVAGAVPRYTPNNMDGSMEEWEDGGWVSIEDYEALVKRFSDVTSERDEARLYCDRAQAHARKALDRTDEALALTEKAKDELAEYVKYAEERLKILRRVREDINGCGEVLGSTMDAIDAALAKNQGGALAHAGLGVKGSAEAEKTGEARKQERDALCGDAAGSPDAANSGQTEREQSRAICDEREPSNGTLTTGQPGRPTPLEPSNERSTPRILLCDKCGHHPWKNAPGDACFACGDGHYVVKDAHAGEPLMVARTTNPGRQEP